ncbi:MAG: elongation factor Ts [Candidatus Komeilibacteria bacterium RIFCSPHIGHO2_01_FULL_52_14]|uniref:Elongation factor Ts n=1 Tax=Candidatus Komeilibacteria bacterium RIFCSPHIGHO2_01_FULL_52_14 TaxID=1798549 RepID=A0A1G2BQ78_9BACT|nr:MAG: elongation factor Ts [Candidatus Komeilibacteria bacterium RIFCSPHIGHO2_01_FULL_52_14]
MADLALVKKIRELTGAGMVDVQQALIESKNNEAKAIEILRKKGQKIADKRQGRDVKEGVIDCYIHGKKAAIVALGCETDFVARNSDFKAFAHELALQVAATAPQYVSPDEIPADIIEKEKEIYRAQVRAEGKPEKMLDKIVEGKLAKFYSETCLLKQVSIKDDKKTIEQLLTELIAKIGENIKIVKFVYFTL